MYWYAVKPTNQRTNQPTLKSLDPKWHFDLTFLWRCIKTVKYNFINYQRSSYVTKPLSRLERSKHLSTHAWKKKKQWDSQSIKDIWEFGSRIEGETIWKRKIKEIPANKDKAHIPNKLATNRSSGGVSGAMVITKENGPVEPGSNPGRGR